MSDPEDAASPPVPVPASPAVHSDTLWDGARFIHNAGPEPIWVETKAQYWDLLNRMGFTMKDQQESTTGPERSKDKWIAPAASHEPIAPAPLTADEAEILYAYQAVLKRYDLVEALACTRCFAAGRPHGMRAFVGPRRIRFECRCGVLEYRPEIGTTDQPHFSQTSRGLGDRTTTDITDAFGRRMLPTETLPREMAKALRQMAKLYTARDWDPSLYCRACWDGRALTDAAMQIGIGSERIALVCQCRVLYYHGVTI